MTIGGTWGKVLHFDLNTGRQWVEEPGDAVYALLLGGRALGSYLLLRHMRPGVDPLGPENVLAFVPGVLQGTNLPGSGRHGIAAKSPLTGALASSEAGGWWGHEFKRTGFDALVVHGRASSPAYIWIHDGMAELRPAGHLWGRDTAEVEELIRFELEDKRVRVAQCGIAGENLVLYANVIHDSNRAAGRNGLGAVMGSKNLKAVAVRGTLRLPLAEPQAVVAVSKWLGQNYKTRAAWAIRMGTPGVLSELDTLGGLPTNNFRQGSFAEAAGVSGELLYKTVLIDRDTCQVCPIACKQVVSYAGETFPSQTDFHTETSNVTIDKVYGGPEYETLGSFGSTCRISDMVAVCKANELSARWGFDTISAGMTVAFAMECVERGLLTAERTGGFVPHFGSGPDLLRALDLMAHRQGFGEQLAWGSKRLAAWIGPGAEESLVEVKGQELPMHEPRLKAALGVGYAVAPVGADHEMNVHDTNYTSPGDALARVNTVFETGPLPASELSERKMVLFFHEVNFMHLMDSALVCHFHPYDYVQIADALTGATGLPYSSQDALRVGERAQTLSRLFNQREGLTAADDRLPKRVMKAFAEGPTAGIEITEEVFLSARNFWYELMGWDEGGVPSPERLDDLGITALLADQ
jgi:aldehyde:ferredoxin oxidoreductase